MFFANQPKRSPYMNVTIDDQSKIRPLVTIKPSNELILQAIKSGVSNDNHIFPFGRKKS